MYENETVLTRNISLATFFWGDYIFSGAIAPFSCLIRDTYSSHMTDVDISNDSLHSLVSNRFQGLDCFLFLIMLKDRQRCIRVHMHLVLRFL